MPMPVFSTRNEDIIVDLHERLEKKDEEIRNLKDLIESIKELIKDYEEEEGC